MMVSDLFHFPDTNYKPRSFTQVVIKKEVTEGHDITISCEHVINSRPKAVIEWRRVTDFKLRGHLVKETNDVCPRLSFVPFFSLFCLLVSFRVLLYTVKTQCI